jgi:predicted CoA-binding protein
MREGRVPPEDPDDEAIQRILAATRTIAVVGLSPRVNRDSHAVAAYLQSQGYRIVPVNPGISEVLGEAAYPDLLAIPDGIVVDMVDIFRRPEHVPSVVDAAIARGVASVWMQLGVSHAGAAAKARAAGIWVVENRCLKVEHWRLARRREPV